MTDLGNLPSWLHEVICLLLEVMPWTPKRIHRINDGRQGPIRWRPQTPDPKRNVGVDWTTPGGATPGDVLIPVINSLSSRTLDPTLEKQ